MKKRFLALTALGVGAGALYAFKTLRGGRELTQGRDESEEGSDATRDGQGENGFESNASVGSSLGRINAGSESLSLVEADEPQIDDRGTHQAEASSLLKNIRDAAFDASDEKLALALGRPSEEIEDWINGTGVIDGDVVMKARVLASERGIHVE
ncbi:MAG: hypothetical protein AABM67_18355 [Acidobacteriota bacterium]